MVGPCREARFQDWGLWPVGWAHGQSFFFQFVALGQVKRPSRRRASFGEVRPGKGWFEGRLQGRFRLWFGWSRFGSAIKSIGLRELGTSERRWQAITWRSAFALGFKPTIKFIRSNGFRPAESAFRKF